MPAGAVDVALLQGGLSWANNPGVVDLRSLADTTTVSPAFGLPNSLSPIHAVTPGMPTTPR